MKKIMSIILCIALVLPCVSNALDKSYLEDFKRIEDYLEEVTQDNTYNKIHFYNGNSDHATIDSPQELCEATDVIAEVAESYNMSLSESVSNLSNEEVNTQREEICVTVQFDSNYFQTDEFIEFSKERYTLKNREEVREFRQRLNAFSKSYHDNLVAQNMHIVSDLNYIEADVEEWRLHTANF